MGSKELDEDDRTTGYTAVQAYAGVNGGVGFGALGEDEEGAATGTVSVTSLR